MSSYSGRSKFGPTQTRIWHIRIQPEKIQDIQVDLNSIRIRICHTYTRKFGLGTGMDRRIGLILPCLQPKFCEMGERGLPLQPESCPNCLDADTIRSVWTMEPVYSNSELN